MTGLQSPLTLKLSTFVTLGETDLATLERFYQRRRTFQPGHALVHEGQRKASAFILARGWACAYKILPDGGRQIVDFQIPGDFLGLRSILFRTADHGIEAVTRIEASEVLTSDILDAFASAPRLAQPSCGRCRGTRRWWWSIWSISAGGRPTRACEAFRPPATFSVAGSGCLACTRTDN
jgi:hypothetical protein